MRDCGTHEVRDAGEVLLDQRVLPVVGHVEELRVEASTGVVHDDVDVTELGRNCFHPRTNCFTVTNVQDPGYGGATGGFDLTDTFGQVELVPVTRGDGRTERGERQRTRTADADGCAGHDRNGAVELY